jgi:flagellar hook assembly protein FlgD
VDVPNQETLTLKVYNILGEEVATLMSGEYAPGRYEVTWTGRDDHGLLVASGVYLYKLNAGPVSQTRKMLLTK